MLSHILYYDCFAGISGDMHLAALLDLGVDYDELVLELAKLGVDGYGIQAQRASRKGITGTQVRVVVDPKQPHHRNLRQIEALIGNSLLADAVRARAITVFRRLAEAEARIHDTSPDQIHFHEVGALDAIVDIVGGAIALEWLNVDRVLCSPVELGSGIAYCEHGVLPVPAPATLELLKGVPVRLGAVPFEATTPTGAALLATFVDEFVECLTFSVNRIGYGVGHRDGPIPNVLRVCLGEQAETEEQGELWMLECNIDDMNPEYYDHVLDRLLAAGALDTWLTPVQMKKNRPGTLLSVLCPPPLVLRLRELLFIETTTLGVRAYPVQRTALVRETISVATRYGEVAVKVAYFQGRPLRGKPEYEDCKRVALEQGVPLHAVYAEALAALNSLIA
ncbi:MAG TPA: nickel pincer cofactor biosynthesis protein LarC [Candidatus Competibacteraceae bacterium]|nr:nickel pincer cofactor biosynthesis protein LarC [Candidatus Competibacteraceae bacterium]HRZ05488.1 nickel pincer cofactor biosynthesis protein LarC [Candidatus Competibacteraceae bacterium]HSA48094.1 nickel pincer cofactor biosynthesis protein LarC [Candidatus Competibacteraceae bacterium]